MDGEASGEELVTIAAVYVRSELYALLALLRTNGIFAAPVGENHARVDWALVVALGGVRVQVRARDLALAAELLAGIDHRPLWRPMFSENKFIDLALTVLLFLASVGIPPPSRIPAAYFLDRQSFASKAK